MAKGPSAASIQGPDGETVTISGDGEDGGISLIGRLTEATGFFAAVFRPSPDPMLRVRPEGELGPRYKITWLLRTPTGKSRLYQDAYPYAEPHPLTYMARGQTFYNGMTTNGGWYVSGPELEKTLLESVKATNPRPPSKSGISSGGVIGIAAATTVTFLAIALLLLIRLRRRSHATVTA